MAGPNSLYGPLDPAPDAGYVDAPPRMGFFTDTSICIGCKACEVACKEWNLVPEHGPLRISGNSYDNTMALGANTWRHVAFVEQPRSTGHQEPGLAGLPTGPSGIPETAGAVESRLHTAPRGGSELGTEPLPPRRPEPQELRPTEDLGMPGFSRPGGRRRLRREPPAARRLLHRHLGLHRL